MKEKKRQLCALLLLMSLFWIDQAQAAPLRFSYSIIGPQATSLWMAQETGAFGKYGLDVQLIYIPASSVNIQALLGGSIDIAMAGSAGVVLGAARGAPVVAFASTMNRPPMTLYVQPEISRVEQLRGQTLGITRFNSSSHTVTTLILRKLGLAQAVIQRPMGGNPQIQAAFEQKQIAGMVTAVKPRATANALLNAADLDIPYATNVLASTRDFLERNPDTVERALRAWIEGIGSMVQDKRNTLRVLGKYLKRPDPAFLEEMYGIAYKFTERTPRVDTRTVATVLEFEPVIGADPEGVASRAIDNGIVERLVKEGFIEKVFGQAGR